jgi:hypothetical protein
MKAGKFPPFEGTMKEKVHHLVAGSAYLMAICRYG